MASARYRNEDEDEDEDDVGDGDGEVDEREEELEGGERSEESQEDDGEKPGDGDDASRQTTDSPVEPRSTCPDEKRRGQKTKPKSAGEKRSEEPPCRDGTAGGRGGYGFGSTAEVWGEGQPKKRRRVESGESSSKKKTSESRARANGGEEGTAGCAKKAEMSRDRGSHGEAKTARVQTTLTGREVSETGDATGNKLLL
jgi:hypothetical protein